MVPKAKPSQISISPSLSALTHLIVFYCLNTLFSPVIIHWILVHHHDIFFREKERKKRWEGSSSNKFSCRDWSAKQTQDTIFNFEFSFIQLPVRIESPNLINSQMLDHHARGFHFDLKQRRKKKERKSSNLTSLVMNHGRGGKHKTLLCTSYAQWGTRVGLHFSSFKKIESHSKLITS